MDNPVPAKPTSLGVELPILYAIAFFSLLFGVGYLTENFGPMKPLTWTERTAACTKNLGDEYDGMRIISRTYEYDAQVSRNRCVVNVVLQAPEGKLITERLSVSAE